MRHTALVLVLFVAIPLSARADSGWMNQVTSSAASGYTTLPGAVKSKASIGSLDLRTTNGSGLFLDVFGITGGYHELDLTAGIARPGPLGLTYSGQGAFFYLPDEKKNMWNARTDVSGTIGNFTFKGGLWYQAGLADRLMGIADVSWKEPITSSVSVVLGAGGTYHMTGPKEGMFFPRASIGMPVNWGDFTITPSYRVFENSRVASVSLSANF